MGKNDKDKGMCEETEWIDGHEFVCILPYHQREYKNNGERRPMNDARGNVSRWRRHWFTRKYPYGGGQH
jgi:hypothetical protein